MADVQSRITIVHPVAEVFAMLLDLEKTPRHVPAWQAGRSRP